MQDCSTRTWISKLKAYGLRLFLVSLGLFGYFFTQYLLAIRPLPEDYIGDVMHHLTAPLNTFFLQDPSMANGLLIFSSMIFDIAILFLFAYGIFGQTIRPLLGLFIVFSLRQVMQYLCPLHPPEGLIYHDPGFPSLFVTYGTPNDFFFSGHTATAIYATVELSRLGYRWLTSLGVGASIFIMAVVLILRMHYTMDVYAGLITALCIGLIAPKLAAYADQWINRALGIDQSDLPPELLPYHID